MSIYLFVFLQFIVSVAFLFWFARWFVNKVFEDNHHDQ